MKKINFSLIIGFLVIVLLVLVALYPEYFSKIDPYCSQKTVVSTSGGAVTVLAPLMAPNKEYVWGTDNLGRDLKSLIVYGCKRTILIALFIALGRLILALPIAVAAAYKNRFASWIMKQFNTISGAFPVIFLVFILSRIALLQKISDSDWGVFGALLIIFGWSRLASTLSEKISNVLNEDFIEGEVAIGKSKLEIAYQNIIPHIIPNIIVLYFLEVAMVLLIMTQIGVLTVVFRGYYTLDALGGETSLNIPRAFDWVNLLVLSHIHLSSWRFWLVIYPAMAFAISIIGFNLFGEGLKNEFEKRESKVITIIRRIPSILSPSIFVYQIRNFKVYKKNIIFKVVLLITVLTIVLFPHKSSLYKFEAVNAINIISELSDEKYDGRYSGSEQCNTAAMYIAGLLDKYKLKPFDGSYLHEFQIKLRKHDETSTLVVNADKSEEFELVYLKDYEAFDSSSVDGSFEIFILDDKAYKDIESYSAEDLNNKIVLFDRRGLTDVDIDSMIKQIGDILKPMGIAYVDKWYSGEGNGRAINKYSNYYEGITLSISSDMGDKLLSLEKPSMKLTYIQNDYMIQKGYNIAGYIEGTDKSLENEVLVIGSSYDYIGNNYPGAMELGGAALEMELARVLSQNNFKSKRTIIFVFWDGTYSNAVKPKGPTRFIRQYLNNLDKTYYYFDLRSFSSRESDLIMFDINNIKPADLKAQSYIRAIRKTANMNDVKLANNLVDNDIKQENINSIIFDGEDKEKIKGTVKDTVDKISIEQLDNAGQMLLDAIVSVEYNR